MSSNPTPSYVSAPIFNAEDPDHINQPAGPLPSDADINPSYFVDRRYPDFPPDISIPVPTAEATYVEPVIRLLFPCTYKLPPLNIAPYATVSKSALLPLKSKY